MAANHKYCRKNLWKRYDSWKTVDGPGEKVANPCNVGRCLAFAELGSWVQLNMGIQCFCCLLVTYRHMHAFHLAVPTTPMWGKTIAAATDLSFHSVTKERPPSVPGLSMLLMGQQKYHLLSPSKDSNRRPHSKCVQLSEIFFFCPFSLQLKRVQCPCEFRCDR